MRFTALLVLDCVLTGTCPFILSGDAAATEPQRLRVSVLAFASDHRLMAYETLAQTRAEKLLRDAGFDVLDEAKAADLRRNWIDLADPDHVITAEEIAANARKYHVDRVVRLSLNGSVNPVFDAFYTASATVEWRLLDPDASVRSMTSSPMGTRGLPPSDGLTESAALSNATLRAVDNAAERSGLSVSAPTKAEYVPLNVVRSPSVSPSTPISYSSMAKEPAEWTRAAALTNEPQEIEQRYCEALSPDGQVGALGGYVTRTIRHTDPSNASSGAAVARAGIGGLGRTVGMGGSAPSAMTRLHGGRIHLVDVSARNQFNLYTVHEVGMRARGEDGLSAPLACQFLGDWRYLLVVTGNQFSCYDVERGIETCRFPISDEPKTVRIGVTRAGGATFVVLDLAGEVDFYKVVATR